MTRTERIYTAPYAEAYDATYLRPWRRKHEVNERLLSGLLAEEPVRSGVWLDLGCGQAWHFSRFAGGREKLGVDLSPAQLARARGRDPRARFLCADMATLELPAGCCSLVTCFWGAYCYLDDEDAILGLVHRACRWLRPGGALYVEVLPPENLASFNDSRFGRATGFRVLPRTDDFRRWAYDDPGGRHLMTSPPTSRFLDRMASAFGAVEALPSGFMVHVVGRDRRR